VALEDAERKLGETTERMGKAIQHHAGEADARGGR
jgi:hypothetical protein